jgi:hypothetical protein
VEIAKKVTKTDFVVCSAYGAANHKIGFTKSGSLYQIKKWRSHFLI